MITVIGKLADVERFRNRTGYNVMIDAPDWTPELNHAWLSEAVERGDQFLLVTPRASGQYAVELRDLCDLLTKG
jgi:hypothetical protein